MVGHFHQSSNEPIGSISRSQMMTGAPSVVQETRGATSHLCEGFAIEVKLGRVPFFAPRFFFSAFFQDVLADGVIFQNLMFIFLYRHTFTIFSDIKLYISISIYIYTYTQTFVYVYAPIYGTHLRQFILKFFWP